MMIDADRFTPVAEGLIPSGEVRSVGGIPLDFRQPVAIGARIDQNDPQLKFGGGYDHNWVLKGQDGSLALAARVYEPTTGRVMEVYTTEPGLQFYSGNFLDGSQVGKGGLRYEHRSGFCLETQHFPDSPNKPGFPSTVLEPGRVYTHTRLFTNSPPAVGKPLPGAGRGMTEADGNEDYNPPRRLPAIDYGSPLESKTGIIAFA